MTTVCRRVAQHRAAVRVAAIVLSLAAASVAAAQNTAPATGASSTAASISVPGAAPAATGPVTPYGETPQEAANKQLVFDMIRMALVDGNVDAAFERYVDRNFREHSHLFTGARTDYAGYDAELANAHRLAEQMRSPAGPMALPTVASVDGEMVTLYGAGVDIVRVHDGRITDHWDASPPAQIMIQEHAPGFTAWVLGERKGPPPHFDHPSPSAVTINMQLLTAVNQGPISPFGETPQEMANKRVLFEWNHLSIIEGRRKEAFEKYVSRDFCDHSHMSTRAQKDCAGFDELAGRPAKAVQLGDTVELPIMATVDGDMVTMYGAGVDIFRVVDGRITDHWDATSPSALIIKAHPASVVDRNFRIALGLLEPGAAFEPTPGGNVP
jgi:predicted SnoaL-like aldol condensation-catalyzing enzyme